MAIVTLTMNPSVDTTTVAKRLLPDRKLRCREPIHEPGGGGINVARAVNKLGGNAVACFPAGGTHGDHLQHLLSNEGAEIRPIAVEGMTRQNVTVRDEADEQQYRFVMPGPQLAEAEWKRCLTMINDMDSAPEYVVVSGSLPPGVPDDFYAQLAEVASKRKIRLVVDSSGEPLRRAVEHTLFLIKPNVREITGIMDLDVGDEQDIENAARQLHQKSRCRHIVVSLGAGGLFLITETGARHIRAPTVPIKSKVGAGDSTVAGIVLGLTRTHDIIQAAKFGVAAGASAVMTPGTELCRRDKTEDLLNKMD